MARGLSELQHSILKLAWRNRQIIEEAGRKGDPDVSLYEMGMSYYLKQPLNPLRLRRLQRYQQDRVPNGGPYIEGRHLNALSRAFGRLERRGLLIRRQLFQCNVQCASAASLTREGVTTAERLLVGETSGNKVDQVGQKKKRRAA